MAYSWPRHTDRITNQIAYWKAKNYHFPTMRTAITCVLLAAISVTLSSASPLLAGGPSEQLTGNEGQHTVLFSPKGDAFVDTWSKPDQPPASVLRRADGQLLTALSTADRSRLDALGWVPPREFTTVAADGETELWGTMYFPNGFDPGRTYPVIEHIYGGAQWTFAAHSFEPDGFAKAEAGAPSCSASYSQALPPVKTDVQSFGMSFDQT